jgi:hypothetical protein
MCDMKKIIIREYWKNHLKVAVAGKKHWNARR